MKKRLLLTMANLLNTLKKAYQQTESCRTDTSLSVFSHRYQKPPSV